MPNTNEIRSRRKEQYVREGEMLESAERRQYTLKGVESEAVDLMRLAADAQGMKIGHWVSDRIKEAAKKALVENGKQREILQYVASDDNQSSLRTLTLNEGVMSKVELEERVRRIEIEIQDLLKQQRNMLSILVEKLI
jgi:hypothetical protein